jgi:hypothetical protein
MAFANRADLASAVTAWLKGNATLTTRIPDFIRLTEARLNRLLRDPDQIATASLNLASGSATLPTDFGELVQLGDYGYRLRQVSASEFGTYQPLAGNPRVYAINAGSMRVLPATGSATTPISYYRAITPLANDGDSNWLLARAPDVYLYGALLQAEFFGWTDERLPMIKAAWDEAISELRADGTSRRWGVGLAPKLGRT